MGAKKARNTPKENELSNTNLLDSNQGNDDSKISSFASENTHTPYETDTLQADRNKIIIKELKLEYKGENDAKNDTKSGEKNNSKPSTFEWKQFKKLLSYVQKERALLFVNYASLLIFTLSQAFIPYMIGRLLNEVTKAAKYANVSQSSLIFLGLIIITCVFGFGRMIGSILLGQNVMQNLKRDIFFSFLGYDLAFFEKHKTGELMSRLGRDVAVAKETVSYNFTTFIKNLLICLSNVVMMFHLSWKVSLAILPIFPTYYVATRYYFSKRKQIEKKCSDISVAQFEIIEEVFSGIMTVKAFGQEKQEIKRFDQILQDDFAENRVYGYLNAGFMMMNYMLLENIGVLIVLWYGGYLVTSASDGLSSGDLASFILYSTSLATNSSQFSYVVGAIISTTGALERIFEMMEYDPAIKITTGKETKILRGAVKFEQVKFSYPGGQNVQVLHGIDFEIKSGQCVAFVGTSGSGKSTVVKLIERFYDTTNGSVLLDGHNVKKIKASSIREHISIVSQEPILFSGSILDNIIYGVESYTFNEVKSACDMSGVSEFMKNKSLFPHGYQTIVGERGTKLSGGQKQRVAIARALIKKPQILIFDEATSALDSESEYQVQQSIDSLIRNRTMTIIVVAHRLSTIKDCSKIFVMQQGKIVEQGSHSDLIGLDGAYKQLVERQLSQKV